MRKVMFPRLPGSRAFAVLPLLAALAGCSSLAPDYQRPASSVPQSWPQGAAYGQQASDPTQTAAALPWKAFIKNERLQKVIALALENNQDLRAALADVAAARATYRE